jgi:hypothetical protein
VHWQRGGGCKGGASRGKEVGPSTTIGFILRGGGGGSVMVHVSQAVEEVMAKQEARLPRSKGACDTLRYWLVMCRQRKFIQPVHQPVSGLGQLFDSEAFVVSVAKQEACKNRTEGGSTRGWGGGCW